MTTPPGSLAPAFLDTAYVYALVNTRDQWHERAVAWQEKLERERRLLITTQLILVEIADGLAAIRFRAQAALIVSALQSNSFVEITPLHPRFARRLLRALQTPIRQRLGLDRLRFVRCHA